VEEIPPQEVVRRRVPELINRKIVRLASMTPDELDGPIRRHPWGTRTVGKRRCIQVDVPAAGGQGPDALPRVGRNP
jgi:hypothetical protein